MQKIQVQNRIKMNCPLCGKIHEVELKNRITKTEIKGDTVEYNEKYYYCSNSANDENEFATGKMENENLLNARNEYRKKHNLLTSDEIVAIREKYDLSQVDMARVLGWGEATISRYESKAIQDDAYDNVLRIVNDNPLVLYDLLEKNIDQFDIIKQYAIRLKVMSNLDIDGKEYLKRKALESEYVAYAEPCDENGMKTLDIPKVEIIISYIAGRVSLLYKVKLMKMLWYADALSFKNVGHSMTGLVYCHEKMGALPIGHYNICGLERVNVEEEFDGENISYRFLPNNNLDEELLSNNEKEILDKVIEKFKNYKSADIIKYMHEEIAYKETEDKEVIPFTLAAQIRSF